MYMKLAYSHYSIQKFMLIYLIQLISDTRTIDKHRRYTLPALKLSVFVVICKINK